MTARPKQPSSGRTQRLRLGKHERQVLLNAPTSVAELIRSAVESRSDQEVIRRAVRKLCRADLIERPEGEGRQIRLSVLGSVVVESFRAKLQRGEAIRWTEAGPKINTAVPDAYARELRAVWRKAVESTRAVARLLVEAAKNGTARELLLSRRLPLSFDVAKKLLQIGQCRPLMEADPLSLPADWETLYELARIDVPELEALIAAKTVTPNLRLHQAQRLRLWGHKSGRLKGQR